MGLVSIVKRLAQIMGVVGGLAAATPAFADETPERCESVRTNTPPLIERYKQLWSDLDTDLGPHLASASELTQTQSQMYASQTDVLRRIAQSNIRKIDSLLQALPLAEGQGHIDSGYTCVDLDAKLYDIEKSFERAQKKADEIRDTAKRHKEILAALNHAVWTSDYSRFHQSKRELAFDLSSETDYTEIGDIIAQIGDYAQALPDLTGNLAIASDKGTPKSPPSRSGTSGTTYSQAPSRTSVSSSTTSLTLVLDANAIPTGIGQDIINNSYAYAAAHPKQGKSQPRTAYRSPMTRFWALFKGANAEKATRHTSANVLDAIIEQGRDTHFSFSGIGRCDYLTAVAEKTKDIYNNGRYHGQFRISDVEVKGCDNTEKVKSVTTPPSNMQPQQPAPPNDNKVRPGEVHPDFPTFPKETLDALPGTSTDNTLDTLMKTYTAHNHAFSNGLLDAHKYVAQVKAAMSKGNNDLYVTENGRLARAILANEGSLVRKYNDRIADLMEVVADTSDQRALDEIQRALVDATARSYVRRTPKVLAQLAGAALAVEQKQKAVASTLENSVGAGSGPEPLTHDRVHYATARYKADEAIDTLHSALMTENYDLAQRLAGRMSPRQVVKAELEMNRSYALTDQQRAQYGRFFEGAEHAANEREAHVRAQAREQEYAEDLAQLGNAPGLRTHRVYNQVRAGLIDGNTDALKILQENGMLTLQHITAIEAGIDGTQLTAAKRARIAMDLEFVERYLLSPATTPRDPAAAQVIAFPQRTAIIYDKAA
ncbi:hypothetical protein HYY69_00535 [Candidatus Woesearchaeota archaeon]|nr:hypothetical protein [Candidatus Woesearchaeota archaeon]